MSRTVWRTFLYMCPAPSHVNAVRIWTSRPGKSGYLYLSCSKRLFLSYLQIRDNSRKSRNRFVRKHLLQWPTWIAPEKQMTRLGVRQTVSSRNRLSSLNILACSSRSAQPLSRLPPNLGLRRFWLGPSGLDSAFFGATRYIPLRMLSTGSDLLQGIRQTNSGQ